MKNSRRSQSQPSKRHLSKTNSTGGNGSDAASGKETRGEDAAMGRNQRGQTSDYRSPSSANKNLPKRDRDDQKMPAKSNIDASCTSKRREMISPDNRNDNDVLCGRGKGPNMYIGNCRFRDLVAQHQSIYFSMKRAEKPNMSKYLVDRVHRLKPPGRFLQLDGVTGNWYEISDEDAIRKTGQALREGRSKKAPSQSTSKAPPRIVPQSPTQSLAASVSSQNTAGGSNAQVFGRSSHAHTEPNTSRRRSANHQSTDGHQTQTNEKWAPALALLRLQNEKIKGSKNKKSTK